MELGLGDEYLYKPTLTTAGYDVSLTVNGSADTETKSGYITVNALHSECWSGSNYLGEKTLSGSGANTYAWDNGVTNGVALRPT